MRHIEFSKILTDYRTPARRPDLEVIIKKMKLKRKREKTCRFMDFAVLAEHKVKIKENEKKDKYLDLA